MLNENQLLVSSSPHIRSGDSVRGIMLDVVIALLPAGVAGAYFFGFRALGVMLFSVLCAVSFEFLWQRAGKKSATVGDFSAVVTGLLLAYNMPAGIPFWMIAVGNLFAIIVVKQFFGGIGHNFMNPALAARAFLMASWPGAMTTWVAPLSRGADAVSGATALAVLKGAGEAGALPSYFDMLIGKMPGCIGETSSVLLLLGGVYLVLRRVISPRIPLVYMGSVFLIALAFGENPVAHLLSGGLILGAIFMATDYSTSPSTVWGQVIMGLGCGVITMVIRLFGGYPEGVSYSILLMNVAAPIIEKHTRPKLYGEVRAA